MAYTACERTELIGIMSQAAIDGTSDIYSCFNDGRGNTASFGDDVVVVVVFFCSLTQKRLENGKSVHVSRNVVVNCLRFKLLHGSWICWFVD